MNLDKTIETLKAAAEPTRYRLLALCSRGQMSVNELVEVLGQSQPRVSRHLKLLTEAGLVERQRSGKHVYYQIPAGGDASRKARLVLSFIASNDPQLETDLHQATQRTPPTVPVRIKSARLFNRAILDIAATGAIGALLDIGVGSARIMKLLASNATRLVGVDNDRAARQRARQELQKAGLTNCSVLPGDMYQLPFDHGEFNTVIMDEVLLDCDEPVFALTEATRTLTRGGRLMILEQFKNRNDEHELESRVSHWIEQCALTLTVRRSVSSEDTRWLIVIATK